MQSTPLLFVIVFIAGLLMSYGSSKAILYIHKRKNIPTIPLGGGTGIFLSFIVLIFLFWAYIVNSESEILTKHIIGFILGGGILIMGGILDDKYNLNPSKQILFPIIATIIVIVSGVGVNYITNPLEPDKLIYLDIFKTTLITFNGIPYHITIPADIIGFIWLMIIMYATKLQDGLDGLVTGVSLIATVFIILISLLVFEQAGLSLLATIFAGTLVGFLLLNKFPAKIYLGEGGSLFTGFTLGVFAIASDAKVMITLLIIALPIIDAVWSIIRRIKNGYSPWIKDTDHLHHRLVKAGLSHKNAVLLLYALTTLFGILVLLWQSSFTYYFWGLLLSITLIIILLFRWAYNDRDA